MGHLGPAPGELSQLGGQVHQIHQPRNLLGAFGRRPPQHHLPPTHCEEMTPDSKESELTEAITE